jgi:magnesium-transporting ATPase (P-type)
MHTALHGTATHVLSYASLCVLQAITMGMMLAAEPAEADIMERRPRRPGKRLLGKLVLWRCAFVSGLIVVLVLGVYGEFPVRRNPGMPVTLTG